MRLVPGGERELIGFAGVVRVLAYRGGHLFHGRGSLFERGGLLFRALRKIDVTCRQLLRALIHSARRLLHIGDEFGHVVGELVHAAAHLSEETGFFADVNPLLEISLENTLQDALHLRFGSDFLGPVGPLQHRPDALTGGSYDRARNEAQSVAAEADVLRVLVAQTFEQTAACGRVLEQHLDVRSHDGRAEQLRQIMPQIVLELTQQRGEPVVDIDDLELGIRHQHRRAGVIQRRPDPSADRGRGIGLLLFEAAQPGLHLFDGQQDLAGLVRA